jgi:quinol-cytochrome oxidoreductase complex cytochrome b subunit
MADIIGMAVTLVMMVIAVPGMLLVIAGLMTEAYEAIEQLCDADEVDDE